MMASMRVGPSLRLVHLCTCPLHDHVARRQAHRAGTGQLELEIALEDDVEVDGVGAVHAGIIRVVVPARHHARGDRGHLGTDGVGIETLTRAGRGEFDVLPPDAHADGIELHRQRRDVTTLQDVTDRAARLPQLGL
jgi:hypothetical protein